ncbi:hypothetical protein QBC38DRAFT_489296 [Podospora fimiseda]|uniref:Polyketide synthase n=1 Tax=Podospora fimiseda TaxID=252190 RepID=A0AAN6YP34_9PEZI|nr:hypothetical protein QBC38DRAFT_489296 [Podospora fimiseda]
MLGTSSSTLPRLLVCGVPGPIWMVLLVLCLDSTTTVFSIMTQPTSTQTPIAVVGMACRLPGNCNSPEEFWKFLLDGGIAHTKPPITRFSLDGHYDKTLRPWTMRSPGGMFINADPRDLDAAFFGLSQVDAISMDPQQRQLLEVIYEALENAGLPMETIKSTLFGCFVGSYASDYSDIQSRDPEDKTPSFTVGSGRAMLSNRISHFLDIKGPSMTIDTACSGSLIAVDLACRYLDSGDADGAIVAGCNLYMSPEHNMDQHAMTSAASPSGRCWTFDARADGYIKAEAVNCLILKRLDDALRDGDPIRAVIRGTSTNSDGWTPGIASPSADAQALAIRRAYSRAGIPSLQQTAYLECHGTGTLAGDPVECKAASSVFSASRPCETPLRIGSVKSNIGHSEPAAGISGMIKTVLAVERGIIPGNPTFEIPNPKIDFHAYNLLASKSANIWPRGTLRRASVNSFGYGGSNAHAIVEDPSVLLGSQFESPGVTSFSTQDDDLFTDEAVDDTRRLMVFSANDEESLKAHVKELVRHISNPKTKINSGDLTYTLAERRTRHFFRAYAVSDGPSFKETQVVYGKLGSIPRIGFVFTGQGAQWPQMGRELLRNFPKAKETIQSLDQVLQSMSDPQHWSILRELCEPRPVEHYRLPEFSQPLVTALQLAILAVLSDWGVKTDMVVGHSSGEIAAAVAAGFLTQEEGIKVAYLRGKAAKDMHHLQKDKLGMLAVGLGSQHVQAFIDSVPQVSIACINSPKSVTLAGPVDALEAVQNSIKAEGHFARLLLVDLAYHSPYMKAISEHYRTLLHRHCPRLSVKSYNRSVKFFSTVEGTLWEEETGIEYWVRNMSSPVLFSQGAAAMMEQGAADLVIEIGPSGALSGPIKQIKQELPNRSSSVEYSATLERSRNSTVPLYELAGKLFFAGIDINLSKVNRLLDNPETPRPRVIIDLPNYQWNHSIKYWHESLASKDWRYRPFLVHDLLGSKVLGTSWKSPSWRRTLRLKDVPWIRDHTIGTDIVFPASGYVAMAVEAMYQTAKALDMENFSRIDSVNQASYRLRDVRLLRALVVEEDASQYLHFFLCPTQGQTDTWFQFKISSRNDDTWTDHCTGLVRVSASEQVRAAPENELKPLRYPSPAMLWYKSMHSVGFNFGPKFKNLSEIESVAGQRTSRSRISVPSWTEEKKESKYAIHPALFDAFFQAGIPSLYTGHRTLIDQALVPHLIDEIIINPNVKNPETAIATTDSIFTTGRRDKVQNYMSNSVIWNESTHELLAEVRGLHYHVLHVPEASEARPVYLRSSWMPDISLLAGDTDLDSLAHSAANKEVSTLCQGLGLPPTAAYLLTLLKHKQAIPSVLDLNINSLSDVEGMEAHLVDEVELRSALGSLSNYVSASSTPEHMTEAQRRLHGLNNVQFHIYDPTSVVKQDPPFATDKRFDLVLLRVPLCDVDRLDTACRAAAELCSPDGIVILIAHHDALLESSESSWSSVELDMETLLRSTGLDLRANSLFSGVYLCAPLAGEYKTARLGHSKFPVVDLSCGKSEECWAFIQSLQTLGWDGTRMDLSYAATQPIDTFDCVVMLDDPRTPFLSNVDDSDWKNLRRVLSHGHKLKILWITSGSQMNVFSPSNALIHGFARSLRNEESSLSLTTLDLSSFENTFLAARSTIHLLDSQGTLETEYCEKDGVLHTNRVLPDDPLMADNGDGTALREMWFRKNPKTVRLQCERVGAMDSVHFNEVPGTDRSRPVANDEVEVEIRAAGINYKDVITTLGIVPENEHLLGLEGAGIITQIGANITSYYIGDRVLIHGRGCFANRNRVPKENVFRLPDWVSFEEAATMSIVFFTAVYSLMEVAQVKRGQSVLIHSATGGVGIASIQVCKMLGATIYATVGNEQKRQFLMEEHGIPAERIFSSRNSGFGDGIRALTNGKGVDYVLNSLTGDLLDESWRLLADNGMLLEIGKKDMVARNSLSMEPFDRNCTYRGIDISRPSILDNLPLVERILQRIRQLLVLGQIKPITPMKVFSFNKIVDAMRYIRPGEHIGKIVVSDGEREEDIKVPVRQAPHSLEFDSDGAYLIVGGLKGLCGSLAVYMARCGARNLLVMSRSGADDDRSQKVIEDLLSLGASVRVAKGDISSLEDVKRAFKESALPIKGIIQGAMLLRDKTFESMTHQEYHEALASKLAGTWNLHNAADELGSAHKLDFFTMLSSISGVVGTAGQTNYAAGNSFQDAFARYRHSLGLRAHTVDLGIVQDVGYMSEHHTLTDRVRSRSQLSGINEAQLHEILRLSILQQTVGLNRDSQSASQMITGLPFPMPEDSPVLVDKRFHSLLKAQKAQGENAIEDKGDGVSVLHAMVKGGLHVEKLVVEAVKLVNTQMRRVLGLSVDMEATKPLSSYGIDSLAAVDLRNWFKTRMGVGLTTLDVLNAANLETLCGKVVDKLVAGKKD